ncbi:MAG TPA: hypothetical protein ENH25_08795 [candidate division Zixibacteria bacterium]|nr:hypothetical protein [candidate division Zixibacteria bacterium]
MKTSIIVIMIILAFTGLWAQEMPDSVFERQAVEHLTALLNLKPSDIHFRDDYAKKDSFRLETVADLMDRPYKMIEFTERFKSNCQGGQPEPVLRFVFENLRKETQTAVLRRYRMPEDENLYAGINLYYNSVELNRLLMKAHSFLYDRFPRALDSTMALVNAEDRKFLLNEFKQSVLEDTADVNKPVDVLDSIQKVEEQYTKRFVGFATKIKKDFIILAGIDAAGSFYNEVMRFQDDIKAGNLSVEQMLSDTVELPPQAGIAEYLGSHEHWAIGGVGDDVYRGEYHFILDFGGNDIYELSYNPDSAHGTIIIDMSGNDIYNAKSDFVIGSGCFSAGLLYDLEGDDIYNGGNFSCGSGYFGLGLLYDGGGSDKYYGDTHTQGAATFGAGIILDMSGADLYSAALFAQGCGLVEGVGLIADYEGNDQYQAGGKYTETYGLAGANVHYLSLSQGFGHGLQPYGGGGIGAILDYSGNDNYVSDIFGQGASYWWSLGLICDSDGNDQYVSYQYAQGTGVHLSLGVLVDERGDDFYRGKGLMQGVGHDYACGIILDREGDDIYQADDLSQAAGSANGIGLLIDDRGDDRYYVREKRNTHGYGNPRRDFGSIGLFIDMAGRDIYTGYGKDDSYWKSDSKWGGGMDIEFWKTDSTGTDGE